MKLTLEQQRVVNEWLHQKVDHRICQLCGSNRWRIGELLLQSHPGTEVCTGAMVQLVCQNCAQVLLFDAQCIKQFHAEHMATS